MPWVGALCANLELRKARLHAESVCRHLQNNCITSKPSRPRWCFRLLASAAVSQFNPHPVCSCFAGSSQAHSC